MHELGIATRSWTCAERAAARACCAVRLEIGQLSAVLPDALRFCFDVCARGTLVEGANWRSSRRPAVRCAATAANRSRLTTPFGRCDCGGSLRIIAGEELRVKDMEIA